MPRVRPPARKSQPAPVAPPPVTPPVALPLDEGTARLALIQALVPRGLQAVEHALDQEVTALAGARYAHDDAPPDVVRWGQQPGSIFLADQKLPIQVPRVRDGAAGHELPLATYQHLQSPRALDVGLFRRVLGGLSCREYDAAAEMIPAAFGLAKSSVSRRFILARAHELRRLMERRLDDREWLVLLLDGKSFAADGIVIALGVTRTGEKRILGMVQTATEHQTVWAAFLRELVERGFTTPHGLLVVLDGAKGLRAAVRDVFGDDVAVQRCQWHKRENVVRYLPKREQPRWRRKRQAASAHATDTEARRALQRRLAELRVGGAEPGGRARGDADAAPARRLPGARHQLQDDQPDRERHGAHRSQDGARGPLAHQRPEAPLVRGGAARGGAAVPAREGPRAAALAGTRPDGEDHPLDDRRGVSRFPEVTT